MALGISQAPLVRRTRRAAAVALALTMGMASLTSDGAAQQPPAKKAAPPAGVINTWVKLCGKTPIGLMYKDGKEETRFGNFCLTQYERVNETTGPIASVAIRKSDAEANPVFAVTVPLGMLLPAGVRAVLYPAGLWEQAQKNEKVDESKLKGIALDYKMCYDRGLRGRNRSDARALQRFEDVQGNSGVLNQRREGRRPSSGATDWL